MLQYELKKILFRRGGWALIIALLVIQILGLVLFTTPYDAELERNREVYDSYLSHVVGSLDQNKRDFLETEMNRLDIVHREIEQIKQDYFNGTITESEYRVRFGVLLPDDQKYIGFTKLYSQYIFVRESESRSFLYTGGWELLLTNRAPNYLFLIILIIILSPVFCEEYSCQMHEILLTQRKSARYMALTKLSASLIITAILTSILQIVELIYMAVSFGLPNGEFAIQSLMTFGYSTRELTLYQAFWLQFALKELGYLYAAVMILFFSVVLKKYAMTLMASIAIIPLPLLTVNDPNVFLSIPGPWAFSIGSIYLGNDKPLGGILLTVAVILIAMLWIIFRNNTNRQLQGRKILTVSVLLCMLFLNSCTSENPSVYYNRSDSMRYETDRYIVQSDYTAATITDKKTGEMFPFPLNALEGNTVGCDAHFFGIDNTVYYKKNIRIYKTPSGESEYGEVRDVYVKLDLNTMEETILYQWNPSSYWFFGQLVRQSWEPEFISPLFVHNNRLYFNQNSTFGFMDMNTGSYKILYESLSSPDISYDGENLYYLDDYSRLTVENLNTGTIQAVDEVVASRFLLTPEGLFFLNHRDNNTLYWWDSQSGNIEKRSNISAVSLVRRNDGLWIFDIEGNRYCLNHDGTIRTDNFK